MFSNDWGGGKRCEPVDGRNKHIEEAREEKGAGGGGVATLFIIFLSEWLMALKRAVYEYSTGCFLIFQTTDDSSKSALEFL